MFFHLIQHKKRDTSESGFVLVLAMVVLLVISLLGIWALTTSDFELKVAGGSQQVERQFNLAEGAVNAEAVSLGYSQKPFYKVTNFIPNHLMIPTSDADFDPGNDTVHTLAELLAILPSPVPSDNWPWGNLLDATTAAGQAATANEFDYRYLVTYLEKGGEVPGAPGTEVGKFAFHYLRVQGAAPMVIELGGIIIGPK